MDEWVWVKAETGEGPYRAGVWHLTRWAQGRRAVKAPPCGARAPRWVPWLNGPEEPNELCRGCLYQGALLEAAGD